MNAILGPSGCGKSSLLDILAARKDPNGLSGKVFINGQIQTVNFKYRVGYVVQDDILSGTLTVKENLAFSANVRLPTDVNAQEKSKIVTRVIHELGLEKCADTRVGTYLTRGVSGGERKRTNIGMELVLSPSIIFLDEPTTGLDSSTAVKVMKLLHDLSLKGCTMVFSIHQPRYLIYKLFHRILLLSMGRCIYHGSSSILLSYFSSLGFTCEKQENPCDFILDIVQGDQLTIIDTDKEQNQKLTQQKIAESLNDKYLKSLMWKRVKEETDFYIDQSTSILLNETLPKKSRISELYYVSQRIIRSTTRKPSTFIAQIIVAITFAVLSGLVFFKIDHSIDEGVTNRIGAIFLLVSFQIFVNAVTLELFVKERALFIHEHSSGYYHVSTYMVSKLICDLIPLRGLPAILLAII
ncbi:unnamed protein product, partial [Didymodactylos carnosus]